MSYFKKLLVVVLCLTALSAQADCLKRYDSKLKSLNYDMRLTRTDGYLGAVAAGVGAGGMGFALMGIGGFGSMGAYFVAAAPIAGIMGGISLGLGLIGVTGWLGIQKIIQLKYLKVADLIIAAHNKNYKNKNFKKMYRKLIKTGVSRELLAAKIVEINQNEKLCDGSVYNKKLPKFRHLKKYLKIQFKK